jgi:hypothetical protein
LLGERSKLQLKALEVVKAPAAKQLGIAHGMQGNVRKKTKQKVQFAIDDR